MKYLQDYLHLYYGCEIKRPGGFGTLIGIQAGGVTMLCHDGPLKERTLPIGVIKLILRPLSDMQESEIKEGLSWPTELIFAMKKGELKYDVTKHPICLRPTEFIYLLKKRFDIFGLIEAGLAIDKTTITADLPQNMVSSKKA